MKKSSLYDKTGKLVVTVSIPAFNPRPDCIIWANRFFFFFLGKEKKDESGYYEGFAVAAIRLYNESDYQAVHQPEAGNDDLLFGLPSNLYEAMDTFLEFYSTAKDFNIIQDLPEDQFTTSAHHGSGGFLRNSWFLWWYKGHPFKEWPKSKPPIVQFFNDLGIVHADDMSGIILTSSYRRFHKIEIDLEKQIEHYKNYWRQNGFPDGIYKTK